MLCWRWLGLLMGAGVFLVGCMEDDSSVRMDLKSRDAEILVPVAKDDSWTVEEYVAKGMPAVDVPWSVTDYGRAITVLWPIAMHRPEQLPRLESERSGAIVRRMGHPENLAILDDESIPIFSRLLLASRFSEALAEISRLYAHATTPTRCFDAEMVAISGEFLVVASKILPLASQYVVELRPTDPDYAVRARKGQEVRNRLTRLVIARLDPLQDRNLVRPTMRIDIARLAERWLPQILPGLDAIDQKAIRTRLAELQELERDPYVRAALAKASAAIAEPDTGPAIIGSVRRSPDLIAANLPMDPELAKVFAILPNNEPIFDEEEFNRERRTLRARLRQQALEESRREEAEMADIPPSKLPSGTVTPSTTFP